MDQGALPPEVRIVLDTGVFFRPHALRSLARVPNLVVLPAVAFAERARQLAKKGVEPDALLRLLDELDIAVEPFGADEATRHAARITDDARWRGLARDAMIAGHLRENDVLWTTDPKDFEALGVPPERIVAVPPR